MVSLKYRDSTHRYWVDGVPAVGASGLGECLEDGTRIADWRCRHVLLGTAARPELSERAASVPDDRDQLNALVEEAITAGRGTAKAAMGSAAHAHIERHENGRPVVGTDHALAMVGAWVELKARYGLEVVASERIVAHPASAHGLPIAGRFDHLCRMAGHDLPVIVDVKSGANAVRYPLKTAVQLWAYASAPLICPPEPTSMCGKDDGTEEYDDLDLMPGVDQGVAYVALLVPGEPPMLKAFDLRQAREAFHVAVGVRLARKLTFVLDDAPASLDQAVADVEQAFPDLAELRARLVDRLSALTGDQRTAMVRRWPADVPPFRSDHRHTVDELRRVEAELDLVTTPQGTLELAGHMRKISSSIEAQHRATTGRATAEQVASVSLRHDTLPPKAQQMVNRWAFQANEAGTPISVKREPTVHRVAVAHALMTLAEACEDDEDAARAAIALVIPDAAQPSTTLGKAAAALTVEDAERLTTIARGWALHFTADGAPEWRAVA